MEDNIETENESENDEAEEENWPINQGFHSVTLRDEALAKDFDPLEQWLEIFFLPPNNTLSPNIYM